MSAHLSSFNKIKSLDPKSLDPKSLDPKSLDPKSLDPGTVNKVVIIGAGCAGLTAGIYASRGELNPLIFAGDTATKGGLLVKTSIVENFPGFPQGILGYDLVQNMEEQAIKYGAKVLDKNIISVDFSVRPFALTDEDQKVHYAHTVIIATGSKPNKLGLKDEDKFWSRGISSCAVCDGALYKNKKIVVVGGGDSAMEEALFLTKFSSVTLIHRKNTFRASKVMQNRVIEHPKIQILYDTTIEKLHGKDDAKGDEQTIGSITIMNHRTGESQCIEVDGLFYGLGLHPNTEIFRPKVSDCSCSAQPKVSDCSCSARGALAMDEEGYIKLSGTSKLSTETSIPGVFVAGDAQLGAYRQAVVASGDGCRAALDANNYYVDNILL